LLKDGLINLHLSQFTNELIPYKFNGRNCHFLGQHKDGTPNGFIRLIDEYGGIYEGMAYGDVENGTYGWGRFMNDYYCEVGT